MVKIKTANYLISSPDVSKCPPPDRPEFAFIGRLLLSKRTHGAEMESMAEDWCSGRVKLTAGETIPK